MLVNKYRTNGQLAYIELTRGQVTVIDVSDLEKILALRWYAIPNIMGGYYAASSGPIYMHRFILDAPTGKYIDHINHDTLDNRRANLKLCTNQENNVNRNGAYKPSKTGIRGVSTHKCKPSGLMYVFKCSCVTCKACKYFPHTEEGLEDAKAFAEAHYAAMQKG